MHDPEFAPNSIRTPVNRLVGRISSHISGCGSIDPRSPGEGWARGNAILPTPPVRLAQVRAPKALP